jgi:hypothetical protein
MNLLNSLKRALLESVEKRKTMSKTILPKEQIEDILNLRKKGYSSIQIFESIQPQAQQYVKSEDQLLHCIRRIGEKGDKATGTLKNAKKTIKGKITPQEFSEITKKDLIPQIGRETRLKEVEKLYKDIVIDILTHEKFVEIHPVSIEEKLQNPPFDYFGFKGKTPYLIEFKGSIDSFNSPGETQKRRLQELKNEFEQQNLHLALLQVRLLRDQTGGFKESVEYRIFYDDDLNIFFDGQGISLGPVIDWIKDRLGIKGES